MQPIPVRKSLEMTGGASSSHPASDNDLIDFGEDDAKPAVASQPSVGGSAAGGESSKEIRDLLNSTGTQAPSEPLMDFSKDLEKDLPKLRRSDTNGSQDIFHDAED